MNRVLLTLSTAALLALTLLPLVHFAPNRFIGGQAQSFSALFAQHPWWVGVVLLSLVTLFIVAIWGGRWGQQRAAITTAFVAAATWLASFALLSVSSGHLMLDTSPAARVTIGSGFWLVFLLLSLMLLDTWQRAPRYRRWLLLLLAGLAVAISWAWTLGAFDALSLVKEYRNHQDRFDQAVIRHIQLVLLAFVPTLLIGLLLGYAVWRLPRLNRHFFGVLNFLQTVPSIALFALLMAPLAWLATHYPSVQAVGISGIGAAPAVIALVLYTVLPLARNTYAGLNSVPAATREAARSMGMTPAQIFRHIMVPLSLPVVLSGVRIVIVQAIGLTVVAALIGAGGLGIFVWEGLGQYALDLVLLGALPTIALALLADLLLQGLIWVSQPLKHSR